MPAIDHAVTCSYDLHAIDKGGLLATKRSAGGPLVIPFRRWGPQAASVTPIFTTPLHSGMTDTNTELPPPVADALAAHEAFSPRPSSDGGADVDDPATYALETTVFETDITADPGTGPRDGAFSITITLPTLDAATEDHVAGVVEDDWFETLERRLADTYSVAHTGSYEGPTLERDLEAGTVTVTLEYVAWDAREGVEDAKTLIEYVEGTFAQGIIPGYDYRGPAATLLANAQAAGREAAEGNDAEDPDPTGTPL